MSEERYTFSLLLSRIIEIHDKIIEFYNKAKEQSCEELTKSFSSFLKEYEENKRMVGKVKTESIIEFALEPISGLRIDDFLDKIEKVISKKENDCREKAIVIEEEITKLFDSVSKKIAPMSSEATQLLLNSNKRSKKRLENLKSY